MGRHAKPILWGIVFGFAVIVLLESLGWAQKTEPKSKAAAIVNGETILLEEVDSILKQRVQESGPALAPLTASQQRQQRLEVLNALIDEALIRQLLREKGPKIEAAEVDKFITSLGESLKTQKKTVADYCKETGQTEQQLRAGALQMLQMNQFLKDRTSDDDLKKYFELNRDFFDKTTVRASHIVLRLGADASKPEREEAKKKLTALRAEIVAGKKDFAAAAKENSHCPSAPKGGDIGSIYRKWQVDEAFAKAAFALKVGEISEVVETEFGVHIIKVTDRKQGTPTKFELCTEDVRDCYTEELRQNILNSLRQKGKIDILLP